MVKKDIFLLFFFFLPHFLKYVGDTLASFTCARILATLVCGLPCQFCCYNVLLKRVLLGGFLFFAFTVLLGFFHLLFVRHL